MKTKSMRYVIIWVFMASFLALFFLVGCAPLTEQANPVADSLLKDGYPCHRVNEPIKLDGRMGDPAWARAPILQFYVPRSLAEPESRTEARLLYDRNYLYVGFKAYDQDVWSYYTNRDDHTCEEDCLEVFFRTDPEKEPYYNFEINAMGAVYDAYNLKLKFGGSEHRWKGWNCEHLKVMTAVNGTLNNPGDHDQYWTMEVVIPFADLPTLAGKSPQPGDVWSFHTARCEFSVYMTNGIELSSCAPLTKVDFHYDYEHWLKLKFK